MNVVFSANLQGPEPQEQPEPFLLAHEDENWQNFYTLILSLYKSPPSSVAIKYLDDENDWVEMSSQAEFKEALRMTSSSGDNFLQLQVTPTQDGWQYRGLTTTNNQSSYPQAYSMQQLHPQQTLVYPHQTRVVGHHQGVAFSNASQMGGVNQALVAYNMQQQRGGPLYNMQQHANALMGGGMYTNTQQSSAGMPPQRVSLYNAQHTNNTVTSAGMLYNTPQVNNFYNVHSGGRAVTRPNVRYSGLVNGPLQDELSYLAARNDAATQSVHLSSATTNILQNRIQYERPLIQPTDQFVNQQVSNQNYEQMMMASAFPMQQSLVYPHPRETTTQVPKETFMLASASTSSMDHLLVSNDKPKYGMTLSEQKPQQNDPGAWRDASKLPLHEKVGFLKKLVERGDQQQSSSKPLAVQPTTGESESVEARSTMTPVLDIPDDQYLGSPTKWFELEDSAPACPSPSGNVAQSSPALSQDDATADDCSDFWDCSEDMNPQGQDPFDVASTPHVLDQAVLEGDRDMRPPLKPTRLLTNADNKVSAGEGGLINAKDIDDEEEDISDDPYIKRMAGMERIVAQRTLDLTHYSKLLKEMQRQVRLTRNKAGATTHENPSPSAPLTEGQSKEEKEDMPPGDPTSMPVVEDGSDAARPLKGEFCAPTNSQKEKISPVAAQPQNEELCAPTSSQKEELCAPTSSPKEERTAAPSSRARLSTRTPVPLPRALHIVDGAQSGANAVAIEMPAEVDATRGEQAEGIAASGGAASTAASEETGEVVTATSDVGACDIPRPEAVQNQIDCGAGAVVSWESKPLLQVAVDVKPKKIRTDNKSADKTKRSTKPTKDEKKRHHSGAKSGSGDKERLKKTDAEREERRKRKEEKERRREREEREKRREKERRKMEKENGLKLSEDVESGERVGVKRDAALQYNDFVTYMKKVKEEMRAGIAEDVARQSEETIQRVLNNPFTGVASWGRSDAGDAGRVEHVGIYCDNCNVNITGIRYKCGNCLDFDLCETCEGFELHDPTHVFLKLRQPARNAGCLKPELGAKRYFLLKVNIYKAENETASITDDAPMIPSRGTKTPTTEHQPSRNGPKRSEEIAEKVNFWLLSQGQEFSPDMQTNSSSAFDLTMARGINSGMSKIGQEAEERLLPDTRGLDGPSDQFYKRRDETTQGTERNNASHDTSSISEGVLLPSIPEDTAHTAGDLPHATDGAPNESLTEVMVEKSTRLVPLVKSVKPESVSMTPLVEASRENSVPLVPLTQAVPAESVHVKAPVKEEEESTPVVMIPGKASEEATISAVARARKDFGYMEDYIQAHKMASKGDEEYTPLAQLIAAQRGDASDTSALIVSVEDVSASPPVALDLTLKAETDLASQESTQSAAPTECTTAEHTSSPGLVPLAESTRSEISLTSDPVAIAADQADSNINDEFYNDVKDKYESSEVFVDNMDLEFEELVRQSSSNESDKTSESGESGGSTSSFQEMLDTDTSDDFCIIDPDCTLLMPESYELLPDSTSLAAALSGVPQPQQTEVNPRDLDLELQQLSSGAPSYQEVMSAFQQTASEEMQAVTKQEEEITRPAEKDQENKTNQQGSKAEVNNTETNDSPCQVEQKAAAKEEDKSCQEGQEEAKKAIVAGAVSDEAVRAATANFVRQLGYHMTEEEQKRLIEIIPVEVHQAYIMEARRLEAERRNLELDAVRCQTQRQTNIPTTNISGTTTAASGNAFTTEGQDKSRDLTPLTPSKDASCDSNTSLMDASTTSARSEPTSQITSNNSSAASGKELIQNVATGVSKAATTAFMTAKDVFLALQARQAAYKPPQSNYQLPKSSYKPPADNYIPLQSSYQPPKDTYEPPKDTYVPRQGASSFKPLKDTYQPPKDLYKPPEDNYTLPKSTYKPPADTYTPPKSNYKLPESTYKPPQSTYTPPQNTYTPPQSTYMPPVSSWTAPHSVFIPPNIEWIVNRGAASGRSFDSGDSVDPRVSKVQQKQAKERAEAAEALLNVPPASTVGQAAAESCVNQPTEGQASEQEEETTVMSVVVEADAATPARPEVEVEVASELDRGILHLFEMGFYDVELNQRLWAQHQGDLDKVVFALLDGEH